MEKRGPPAPTGPGLAGTLRSAADSVVRRAKELSSDPESLLVLLAALSSRAAWRSAKGTSAVSRTRTRGRRSTSREIPSPPGCRPGSLAPG